MRFVYIAGPYHGKDYHEIERNIAQAREAAAELARLGYGFFCPHLHSAHFEVITPEVGEDFWREMDLAFLRICDAVLLVGNWATSVGVIKELEAASRRGIPDFTYDPVGLAKLRRELPA